MSVFRKLLRYTPRIVAAISAWFFACCLLVCVFLLAVGYLYHFDAAQLREFHEKREAVDLKLRTLTVCVDMIENPERWQGTRLMPPCEGNDEEMIPDFEDAEESWNRVISAREAEWQQKESGRFGFLAKKLHNSYETPFDALPDRVVSYLKWSLGSTILVGFVVSAIESHFEREVRRNFRSSPRN
jgi:hypothetical protein